MALPPGFEPDPLPAGFEPDPLPAGFELESPQAQASAELGQPDTLKVPAVDGAQAARDVLAENPDAAEMMQAMAPGASPIAPAEWALGMFKKHLIAPVVKAAQDRIRGAYESTVAPAIRATKPLTAMALENAGRYALGETVMNKAPTDEKSAGNSAPEYRRALDSADTGFGQYGSVAAATIQALTHGGATLPFYAIPGAGEGVMSALTGGLFAGLADPEAKPAEMAVAGGTLGVGLEVAAGGVKKLAGVVKQAVSGARDVLALERAGRKAFTPVAVVPPNELSDLAKAVHELPVATVSSRVAPKQSVAIAVAHNAEGAVEAKALTVNLAGQPEAVILANGDRTPVIPKRADEAAPMVIISDEVRAAAYANPNGPEADLVFGPLPSATAPVKNPELRNRMLQRMQDWTEWQAIDSLGQSEGAVLAIEGGGGDGTARLYEVNSPKLQREILRQRLLVEATQADGQKVLGYAVSSPDLHTVGADGAPVATRSGGITLLRPDAEEFIPRAAKQDFQIAANDAEWEAAQRAGKVRFVKRDAELDDLLLQSHRLRIDAEDAAAAAAANAEAVAQDVALGGTGDGGKIPPPPPGEPPPPPPPNPHNVSPTDEPKLKWWQAVQGKLARNLLPPTARGPIDLADLAARNASLENLERYRKATFDSMKKSVPGLAKLTPPEQKTAHESIIRYLTGDISQDKLHELVPTLMKEGHDRLLLEKQQISLDQERIIQLGGLQPGQTIHDVEGMSDAELSQYSTQLYWRWMLPDGDWARMQKKDGALIEGLVRDIKRDAYSQGEYVNYTDAQRDALAREHLDILLGDKKAMERLRAEHQAQVTKTASANAEHSLKARKDLRPWELTALGKMDNSFVTLAETRTRQKQLVAQLEIWSEVAANPEFATRHDALTPAQLSGDQRWMEIPNVPGRYGKAAGMYVHPQVYDSLVAIPLAMKNTHRVIDQFVNAVKWGQTVGNPGSWVTNFLANAQGAVLSNMVNPFTSPYSVGKGMLQFGRDMKAFEAAPGLGGDTARRRFTRALEQGIVGSDYATAEFRSAAAEWARLLEKHAEGNSGRINPLRIFPAAARKANSLYGSIDVMWKYAAYASGLEKAGVDLSSNAVDVKKAATFLRGTGFDKPGVFSDQTALLTAVEKEVARRIHYSFPMLDRVAPAVQGLNKHGMPGVLTNPYAKVKFELARNYAQLPARIASEPGMKANLLGYTAVLSATAIALKAARDANGVRSEDVDKAFATAPPSVQRYKPGATALWMRDDRGRLTFVDVTQLFEPMSYLTGDPNAAPAQRVLLNMATSPVSGSVTDSALGALFADMGWAPAQFSQKEMPEWQKGGAMALAKHFAPLIPGVVKNTMTTLGRADVKGMAGPGQVPETAGNTAANLILGPNRIFTAGGPGAAALALKRAGDEINARAAELSRIGPMKDGQPVGTLGMSLDKQEAFAKAKAALDRAKADYAKLKQQLGR